MRIRHTIPFAALGAALLLPAAAGAVSVKEARFAAEVEGLATTTWSLNKDDLPSSPCGSHSEGRGFERFTFSTRNPIRVTARSIGGSDPIILTGPTSLSTKVPVVGRVRRGGSVTSKQNSDMPCGAAGDGVGDPDLAPLVPRSDCGTKPFALDLALQYARQRVSLLSRGSRTQYKHCIASGIVFPYILTTKGPSRLLSASLPKRDIFNRTEGKFVLLGEAVDRHARDVSGTAYTTTIHSTIELKRVD
jgi:hypothetical protein